MKFSLDVLHEGLDAFLQRIFHFNFVLIVV
jgi:hypothetical protein